MKTLKEARAAAGNVSTRNSKMPSTSYAISTKRCKVGGKLKGVKGSVCEKCYAERLEDYRPDVHKGWEKNYLLFTGMIAVSPERWADACAYQIGRAVGSGLPPYHRWFDGGDLQSVEMLRAICLCAEKTPGVRHWLPTREAAIVKAYLKRYGAFPENLVVRISSVMVGDPPRKGYAHTSTVHRKGTPYAGELCEAASRGHKCGPCRHCWDETIANVSYPLH